MKFVHVANVRLGYTNEYSEDFQKVIDACNEGQMDALFITGGLFYQDADIDRIRACDEMLSKLTGTRVFLLAGAEDTERTKTLLNDYQWKSSVIYFNGENIRKVFLAKLDTEIIGIGYQKDMFERLTRTQLLPGRKGALQILLLPFAGTDPKRENMNFLPSGYHYIGLGGNTLYMGVEGRRIYAPGLFEPEGFSNQLKHGYLTGTLTAVDRETPELKVNFTASAAHEYMIFKINADSSLSYEDVEKKVKAAIQTYGAQHYYRVELHGEASQSLYLNKEQLKELESVIELVDYTRVDETLDNMKKMHASDATGMLMEALASCEDEALRKKALKYGIDALLEAEQTE